MHDIGKIGIPEHILNKPGKLSSDEWEIMKTHTTIGAQILAGSTAESLKKAEIIALTHHERWDGTGMRRIKRSGIPLEGRLTAVPMRLNVLCSWRPFKEPIPVDKAMDAISEAKGSHFDRKIVDAFFSTKEEIFRIIRRVNSRQRKRIISITGIRNACRMIRQVDIIGFRRKKASKRVQEEISVSTESSIGLRRGFIQPEALELISEVTARKYEAIPLEICGTSLRIAMANPTDIIALEALGTISGMHIKPEKAGYKEIQDAIDFNYKSYGEIEKELSSISVTPEIDDVQISTDEVADAPVARAIMLIINEAIKARASDIHCSLKYCVRVR